MCGNCSPGVSANSIAECVRSRSSLCRSLSLATSNPSPFFPSPLIIPAPLSFSCPSRPVCSDLIGLKGHLLIRRGIALQSRSDARLSTAVIDYSLHAVSLCAICVEYGWQRVCIAARHSDCAALHRYAHVHHSFTCVYAVCV